jgi:hypothetical protein
MGASYLNRYFYYLVLTNMLVNVLAFVPRVLISNRFDGSVMGLFVSTAIGTLLLVLFCKSLEKFPQQGLPEILHGLFPVWLNRGLLFAFSVILYSAGMITLLAYADFTRKFLNPDITNITVTIIYLSVIVFVAGYPSRKVLFMLEALLVISVPFTLFILFKAFFNKDMKWDAVWAVTMFIKKRPSFSVIAASTYVFSGYANMAIFNRVIPHFKAKILWIFPLTGLTIMFTTFFIPIGFLGADGVEEYTFAWISTADSMRIELGIMERVLFIFLFLYGVIAFASMIIHLHVALEFMKESIAVTNRSRKWQKWFSAGALAVFAAIAIACTAFLNDFRLLTLGENWLKVRFIAEILLVAIMVYAGRRAGRC